MSHESQVRLSNGARATFSYPTEWISHSQFKMEPSKVRMSLSGFTAMNILGYIPFINVIVGIVRIIFFQIADLAKNCVYKKFDHETIKVIKNLQLARGILECLLFFGPLNLILDNVMVKALSKK